MASYQTTAGVMSRLHSKTAGAGILREIGCQQQPSIESTIVGILKRTMLPWSVQAYIRLLFALELSLFVASVSLHGTVFFIGATKQCVQYSEILFRAVVLIGMLVFAFIKDGLRWVEQIKSCPTWMWKGSLIVGIYGILIAVFADSTVTLTGFPIAFEAISICILYSVTSKGYLEKSELARRSLHSVAMAALIGTVILAYRAGYLHPPGK